MSNSSSRRVTLASLVLAGLALTAAGCGSSVSQANYDKVQTGMTPDQVEGILGKGKEQASNSVAIPGMSAGGVAVPGMGMSMKVMTWQDGSKMITVTFQNDKVMGKAENGL